MDGRLVWFIAGVGWMVGSESTMQSHVAQVPQPLENVYFFGRVDVAERS